MLPYSDDYLVYDYNRHIYILTEKDVFENCGINLQSMLKDDIRNSIDVFLRNISLQIYGFIHSFSVENTLQDFIIAKTVSGRKMIKEAMEQQLIYVLTNGDLSRSPKREERELWLDEHAKNILFADLPEIGTSICYCGHFNFYTHDYTKW